MDEYQDVLKRLRVRPYGSGRIVNLIREKAEEVKVRYLAEISPLGTTPFISRPSKARPRLLLPSMQRTSPGTAGKRLSSYPSVWRPFA